MDARLRGDDEYNLSIELEIEPLDTERVAAGVAQVLREQAATRSVVHDAEGGVEFAVRDDSDVSALGVYRYEDLRGRGGEQADISDRTRRASFDLTEGPLLRVVHCRRAAADRLIFACHHLIADGTSWR
ncbi:MAG: condensation domain-containing protein [Actinomycetales bacterium]